MKKIKLLFYIFITFLLFSFYAYSNESSIEIKVNVEGEIITNIDIENETKYLFFLNPKLKNLDKNKIYNISKNSLITDIVKRKELEKYVDFKKENNLVNVLEENLLLKKNIKDKDQLKEMLKIQNLDYRKIKDKLFVEALWNQLIYKKYSKNLVINKEELRKKITDQLKNSKKKYEYNLSEIVFKEELSKNGQAKILEIYNSIRSIGFENTANIYSNSNTAKNGGLIGWINELQISEQINERVINLNKNEVSKPIKIRNAFIIIKLNDKKEIKNKINLETQLEKLINLETNRQLNNFSTIFYKKLKKNLEINES